MFTSSLSNQFIAREGEAPAEPLRRQLGRSPALPLEPLAGRFQFAARQWIRIGKLEKLRRPLPSILFCNR